MGNPTVTPLQEQLHDGGFVVSEGNGHISRDTVTVSGAAKVLAGTVLGKITTTGKFVILAPAATDGSQIAAGILWGGRDATLADRQGVIMARQCEVNASELIWPPGITGPQTITATTQLAAQTVILR
jgi:hypothetical protein